jgi:hypothetical protein
VLYGGVYGPDRGTTSSIQSPFFLALVDSLGVRQVLRFSSIDYTGARRIAGRTARAPERFTLLAARERDSLRLSVTVEDALGTEMGSGGMKRTFLQMRGGFVLRGQVLEETVADSGAGFFETYTGRP